MTWTVFDRSTLRCRACGIFTRTRHSTFMALAGEGAPDARLALIGEGPGEWEEAKEQNFVGRAGEMLDGCIREATLTRADLWIANSLRCRPVTAAGRNRKPNMHEIDCCRGYTVDELRDVKPNVIVALGDVAMTALLGKQLGGITEAQGKVIWSDEFNAWVIPTFHPAYALRKYAQRHWIVQALRLAKEVMTNGGPRAMDQTKVDVILTLDAACAARDDILSHEEFAFDWETKGNHLTRSLGFCLSISVREGHAYVFPRYLSGMIPAWSHVELRALDGLLTALLLSDRRKIGWQISYDNAITKTTLGIWPRNVYFCGLTAHHLWANHLGGLAHGLKACAAAYTPMGRYDDPLDQWLISNGYTDRGKPDLGALWLAPDEIVHLYNGCDSDATLRLKHFLMARLQESGLLPVFFSERMPLVRLYQGIDRQGVRINRPYLDDLSQFLGGALDHLQKEIAAHAGRSSFNPSSHDQVRDLLYEQIGLPVLGRTDSGEPSTREEILKQLEDGHDAVALILAYRAHEKIKGTYVDGKNTKAGQKKALRAVIDDDGYARMNTFISLAETYRFITRKPFPIHTWPKRDPKTGIPSVRALIIPDEDSVFCIRDYAQQEWAITAILAGQKDMIEAIVDRGEDVHEMVTRDLGGAPKESYLDSLGTFHDPEKDLLWHDRAAYDTYKKLRSDWKSTNFAILFRAGAHKLARLAFGCTGGARSDVICKAEKVAHCSCEERAALYIAQYYERFEEIKWFQYNVIKELRETEMVRERFGTYRKLPAINDQNFSLRSEAERQGCNFPVQRGGVAVMIRAMLRLDARLTKEKFPGRIVFSMHDEMIAQFRRDVAEEGMHLMKWAMEAPYRELDGRSLRSDGATVDCWGG